MLTKSQVEAFKTQGPNPREIVALINTTLELMAANEREVSWRLQAEAQQRKAKVLLEVFEHAISALTDNPPVTTSTLEAAKFGDWINGAHKACADTRKFLRGDVEDLGVMGLSGAAPNDEPQARYWNIRVDPDCQCPSILGSDGTRHFRGCPLREKYPTHEAERNRLAEAVEAAGFCEKGDSHYDKPTLWCKECKRDSGYHGDFCKKADNVRSMDARHANDQALIERLKAGLVCGHNGCTLAKGHESAHGKSLREMLLMQRLESAWGVIANVNNGNWHSPTTPETEGQRLAWVRAAARWRDDYFALLDHDKKYGGPAPSNAWSSREAAPPGAVEHKWEEPTLFDRELEEHRKQMEDDSEKYTGQHASIEVRRLREAVQFLLAVTHQPGEPKHDERLEELEKKLDAICAIDDTLNKNLMSAFAKRVDALEKTVKLLDERIAFQAKCITRIDNLSTRVEELEDTLTQDFDTLRARGDVHDDRLTKIEKQQPSNLAGRLDALEKAIIVTQGYTCFTCGDGGAKLGCFGTHDVRPNDAFKQLAERVEKLAQQPWSLGTPEAKKALDEMLQHTYPPKALVEISDDALLKIACDLLNGVLSDAAGTITYTGGPNVGRTLPTQEAEILAGNFKAIRDKVLTTAARLAVPYQPDKPTFMANRSAMPKIVVLCGSTRFSNAFAEANLKETLKGNIVLTVGSMTHSDTDIRVCVDCGDVDGPTPGRCTARLWPDPRRFDLDLKSHRFEKLTSSGHVETKKKLDGLHKHKIDLADEVFVLNVIHCAKCHGMRGDAKVRGVDGCEHDMQPYIGDSTKSEIKHALSRGKPVRFLNDQHIGHALWEEIKPAAAAGGPIGNLHAGETWTMFQVKP